jgi:hypothetical protein
MIYIQTIQIGGGIMDIRVTACVSGGLSKIVILLVLCVSLLMSNWANAEPFLTGVDQIQPYETEQGRTNTPQPSYQEYTPPPSNDRLGNANKTQDINQSEANRVASQKARKHPDIGSGAGVADAATRK